MNALCVITDCAQKRDARGWCKTHYNRWKRTGDPLLKSRASAGEPRRWIAEAVATRSRSEGCWLDWPFGRGSQNRPAFGGVMAAWIVLENDGRPRPPHPNNLALHTCPDEDNGECLNPAHLRWGSRADNARDASQRGQLVVGESHHKSCLTERDVREIRDLAQALTHENVGDYYGITKKHVQAIVYRKVWKHV